MSALIVKLKYTRSISNSFSGMYLPTLLTVITTFTTFWFGTGSSSERVTVGMTALLAIVTTFAQTRKELPPVSYVTVGYLNV
ncbi:Glycine receptor subunit beta-type 4-like protein [Dinothrombium tinctorium]|uniref:Glycine receptor subunit beta-type 4-like protein n=1 Tax=Dinothrombium tinctorium TaxID=1965070 RepID=A0A3S3PLJ2_9ACAR|nr:Glycine receptor subunit beta-type 4-like protein [Dinothrombium tinctorium]RWS15890.1 Glycine receptor subunit beta-type 4-like protein [Dinothrombium tinctorium]